MPFPDFIIAGAQKSGTTALHDSLRRHPQVAMNRRVAGRTDDEVHFFDKHWDLGAGWYAAQFPRRWPFLRRRIGEKTPNYLLHPLYHERMHQVVPEAQLVVLLRHPVDRAYSQWNHFNQGDPEQHRHWGWEVLPFEQAFREDHGRMRTAGMYGDQLAHLLRFYPREQVHVGVQERFRSSPEAELERVLEFLGLRRSGRARVRNAHERDYREPLDPSLRAALARVYEEPNERLFGLLGERITEWA